MKRQDYILNPALNLHEKQTIEQLNSIATTDIKYLIQTEEEKYHKQIEDLVEDFLSYDNKRIILLAGPTSSGKTTTSKIIDEQLEKRGYSCETISLDDFLLPLESRAVLKDGSLDYDSFATMDVKAFNAFIKKLFHDKEAFMPKYNFVKNRPDDELVKLTIKENSVLIVEGLHALNPNLLQTKENKNFAYTVFICPNVDFYLNNKLVLEAQNMRLMRRALRDYYKRGASINETLRTWQHTIDSENLYIKPYRHTVDYKINSTLRYEILVYAKYLRPLLEATEGEKLSYPLIQTLDACEKLDKNLVPADSMLWEFLPEY